MTPLERDESKGLIRSHADTLQAKLTLIEIAGGRDRELSQEAVMAEEAAQSVISGAQKLFRVSCVLILREKSLDALRKKAGSFWDTVMGEGAGQAGVTWRESQNRLVTRL